MDSDIKLMFRLCTIFIGLCAIFLSIIVLTPPAVPQCKDVAFLEVHGPRQHYLLRGLRKLPHSPDPYAIRTLSRPSPS